MKLCACGCGQPLPNIKYRSPKQPTPRYIRGHNFKKPSRKARKCPACGKLFLPNFPSDKKQYCSQKCANAVNAKNRRSRVQATCIMCNKIFAVRAYRAESAKYCSKKCWSQRNPPTAKRCSYCNNEFETYDRDAIFCSRSCFGKWKSQNWTGRNSPAWKGGKAAHRKRSKYKGDLAKWRKAIFVRDNYTCQDCGAKGIKIHAHHIKPLADFPDLALDISNGKTVCIPCHEKIHGRKLVSPSKYPKNCIDCGAKIGGHSYRCLSCGVSYSHVMREHRRPKKCLQCNKEFIPQRASYKYCSPECRKKASRSKSKTVYCCICGQSITRPESLIQKNKTGKWYCSYKCHRARPTNTISLICPICNKEFKVKPYRTKSGKVVTCSRKCARHCIGLTNQSKKARSQ